MPGGQVISTPYHILVHHYHPHNPCHDHTAIVLEYTVHCHMHVHCLNKFFGLEGNKC